jgi:hypothetical protein
MDTSASGAMPPSGAEWLGNPPSSIKNTNSSVMAVELKYIRTSDTVSQDEHEQKLEPSPMMLAYNITKEQFPSLIFTVLT